MTPKYRLEVEQRTNEIINILKEEKFFADPALMNESVAFNYFNELFTNKFIKNESFEFKDDDEIEKHLDYIMVLSTIENLKERGFMDSYKDENTEEIFFLTKKGKEAIKKRD